MNDVQRTRILLLLMAGVLLVGGSLLWVNTHHEGPDDMAMQQSAQLQAVLSRRKHKRANPAVASAQAPATNSASPQASSNVAGNAPGSAPANPSANVASNVPGNVAARHLAGAPIAAGNQSTSLPTKMNRLPVAHLSSVNSVKEKLAKMMADTGLAPPNNAKPEAVANAAVNLPVINELAPKRNLAATAMAVAVSESKTNAGRKNPFEEISGFQSFPRAGAAAQEDADENGESAKSLALRVKDKVNGKGKSKHDAMALVPPPPPVSASLANGGGGGAGGVSLDELPAPPARPSIADKMRVMAVIGDHVLLSFTDKKTQHDNNWPNTITLGPGDKFESVSLIKVGDDSVTLDDDGERMVKVLDAIK